MLKQLSLIASTFFVASISFGKYLIADYQKTGRDPNKPTHIIVAAKGNELGLQFQMSAAAHARKILDVNPNDQIVIISVLEDDSDEIVAGYLKSYGYTNVVQMLDKWGYSGIETSKDDLDGKRLVDIMDGFKMIASWNVYSHSTTGYGLILDGSFNRADFEQDFSKLKDNFMPGAYAWLHGCNTGQILSAVLSNAIAIPVGASYTSTAFEELYFDNSPEGVGFYHSYPGNVPETLHPTRNVMMARRIGTNKVSYKKTQTCDKVPCVRMMPDNVTYVGYWGEFKEGGLGFYRFRCVSPGVSETACKEGAARALINHISDVYTDFTSDLATFKKAAQDFLCPSGKGRGRTKVGYSPETCAKDLEESLTNPNKEVDTFAGKSIMCSGPGKKCLMKVDCSKSWITLGDTKILEPKSCSVTNEKPRTINRTQADEYKLLVEGFQLLKKRGATR